MSGGVYRDRDQRGMARGQYTTIDEGTVMTKSLLAIGILILLAALVVSAYAAPWLVSDPYPADQIISKFQISIDGGAYVDSIPQGNALRYDFAGIANGSHTIKARACNLYGCSPDSAPFELIKSIPGVPTNITISAQ